MNYDQSTSPMLVPRPLTERIVDEILDALRSAETAFADFWTRRAAASDDARAFASIARLNEHALKDIGAPDWMVARAAEEREARHLRWIEFDVH